MSVSWRRSPVNGTGTVEVVGVLVAGDPGKVLVAFKNCAALLVPRMCTLLIDVVVLGSADGSCVWSPPVEIVIGVVMVEGRWRSGHGSEVAMSKIDEPSS